jgi:hypothetical protein
MTSNLFTARVRCLLLAGLAGIGCHSGELAPIALEDLAIQAMHADCNLLVACGDFPDATTCRATFLPFDSFLPTIEQDVAAGRVLYDGHKARACFDMVAQLDECSITARVSLYPEYNPICRDIFVGTVPPGGACFLDAECDSGLCELSPCVNACCVGVCRARPAPGPLNGPCAVAAGSYLCAEGTVCNGAILTCVIAGGEGATCSSTTGCAFPYFCKRPDSAVDSGICSRLSRRGEACATDEFPSCDDPRDYCDPGSRICVALPTAGQSCIDANPSGTCAPGTSCVDGMCAPLRRTGDTCGATVGWNCLGTLTCDAVSLRCVVPTERPACW